MIDLEALRAAVSAARRAGEQAAKETPDGGSCSLDCVHIPVGKRYPIARRSLAVREALGGDDLIERTTGHWRGYLITPPGAGRASTRLAACEAMAKALKRYEASVYYARD